MHIKTGYKKISGFTFVEMMVALTINVILLGAFLGAMASFMTQYNNTIRYDALNQQLQIAMNLMVTDIRRAGYWANATNDVLTGLNTNPYMVTATDVTVPSSSCILFTYDRTSNGSLPAIASGSDDERYGFRLSGTVVQARPPGASYSCTAAASAWENITDSSVVTVTNLTFTLSTVSVPAGAVSSTMKLRTVDISITGRLVADATVTRTLTQSVRIRNDKYVP